MLRVLGPPLMRRREQIRSILLRQSRLCSYCMGKARSLESSRGGDFTVQHPTVPRIAAIRPFAQGEQQMFN